MTKSSGYNDIFDEYYTLYSVLFIIYYIVNISAFVYMRRFEKKGLLTYFVSQYGFYLATCVFNLYYGLYLQALSSILTAVIFFIPEFIYYKKRMHLFEASDEDKNIDDRDIENLKNKSNTSDNNLLKSSSNLSSSLKSKNKNKDFRSTYKYLVTLIIIYIVLVIVQSIFFIPYDVNNKFVVRSGYTPIYSAESHYILNYGKLLLQICVEGIAFAVIYLSTSKKFGFKCIFKFTKSQYITFLAVLYLVAAALQSLYFMPFYLIEVNKDSSSKSVITKKVIAEGYAPITDINYSYRFDSKKEDGDRYKVANYPKLITHLSSEFAVFALLCLFTYKKFSSEKQVKQGKNNTVPIKNNIDTVIKYYKKKISELSKENKEYACRQKAYDEFISFLLELKKINSDDYDFLQDMIEANMFELNRIKKEDK